MTRKGRGNNGLIKLPTGSNMHINWNTFCNLGKKLLKVVFSRWRFLTLYLAFAGITLSGWYIDIIGWFTSTDDFAASFQATFGGLEILNVVAFLIGSIVFLGYLWTDIKTKRLERMISGGVEAQNKSVFGDAQQQITSGNTNSPALNAPQAPVTINYNGITEERSRAIFDEKLPIALQNYSVESVIVAKDRAYKFRQKLVPRLGEEEKGFECFADPNFLFLLMEAQKAAASTDRESDYDVLSELLANRVKVATDRSLYLGINKAVSVLPFVSDEQLVGMTVEFCIAKLSSKSNNIIQGLAAIDDCYGKIIGNCELPKGDGWLDSLEAGGLVKNLRQPLQQFKKSRQIILEIFEHYTRTGIKKGSEKYFQAIELLKSTSLTESVLIEHELNNDYVRILALDEVGIDGLVGNRVLENGVILTVPLNDAQKEALRKIIALYEGEEGLKEDFKNRFVSKFMEFPNLKKVMEWWDANTSYYELTIVGNILANANANKCDARIPIIVK